MNAFFCLVTTFLMMSQAHGQDTLLLDQYSSLDETVFPGSGSPIQSAAMPFGQSFTPTLTGVDFIRLNLNDYNPGNFLGVTLYVILHSSSMSGPVLGTSGLVSIPDNTSTISTFFFPTTAIVTPNTTYYFEVLVQSGDAWDFISGGYNYAGGVGYVGGAARPASDLWFQEGVIVPEPSIIGLLALSGAVVWLRRRRAG